MAALAALLSFVTADAARADVWAGGAYEPLEIEVPAGAIPPGPAVAGIRRTPAELVDFHHTVHFEMPAEGAAQVRLWSAWYGEERVIIDVRAATGETWTINRTDWGSAPTLAGKPLFLGSADELAAFVEAMRVYPDRAKVDAIVLGLELDGSSDPERPDCRRLAGAILVATWVDGKKSIQPLVRCAARGTRLLLLGGSPGGELGALGPGVAWRWGSGRVAWGTEGTIPGAAIHLFEGAEEDSSRGMPSWMVSLDDLTDDEEDDDRFPGTGGVLLLLALYVAAIGPIGYWVGIRPRRVWLAWGWFPLVALATTAALAGASATWRSRAPELVISHVMVTSPAGVGLESTGLRLTGSYAASYRLTIPWRDGDLRTVSRPYRFGSPFSRPAGGFELVEETRTGTLSVDRMSVGRYAAAMLDWVTPVEVAAPRLVRKAGKLHLVNDTGRSIERAVVITRSTEAEALGVAPHEERSLVSREPLDDESTPAWVYSIRYYLPQPELPTDAYVIGVMYGAEEVHEIEATPPLRTRERVLHVVVGALPSGEEVSP